MVCKKGTGQICLEALVGVVISLVLLWWLWGVLAVPLFGAPAINLLQALGLQILVSGLLGPAIRGSTIQARED